MSKTKYSMESDGRFVIENYNQSKLFYSFFPGIAGERAIPIWAFYVNRGQCMAGFGIQNKDYPLMEFVPGDKAPWYAAWRGFRTFMKIATDHGTVLYEPFRIENEEGRGFPTTMTVTPSELEIAEVNTELGIQTKVTYFTLPGERLGGLYRRTTISNHSSQPIKMEVIDGLAVIVPFGMNNAIAKNMGYTIRAWMDVEFVAGVPYYGLRYLPADVPELYPNVSGNFYLGYTVDKGCIERLDPIIDPTEVFGDGTDFMPTAFAKDTFEYHKQQATANHHPSAMGYQRIEIPAGGSVEIYGLFGHAPNQTMLREFLASVDADYYDQRRSMNQKLIKGIRDYAFTLSGQAKFDHYMGQVFMDNVVRGGVPITLTGAGTDHPKVFWLYSRKHGDLERDYNDFSLSPSYFSQGNGNFRDVNQNRRNDVWFNTDLRDSALRFFWNLIQLDGFNPLVINGLAYFLEQPSAAMPLLQAHISGEKMDRMIQFLEKPFTPGELLFCLEQELHLSPEDIEAVFLPLIELAHEIESAEVREGYWIDHWIYNLDLFDAFLSIYPDRWLDACLRRRDYTFFDSWDCQATSENRFWLINGEVRQGHCVYVDNEKKKAIKAREQNPHLVRSQNGDGPVYTTTLIVKMLALGLNKLASFDPFQTGLEMDAGKPGWCDAVNGLPGILGSSTCEVFALQRLFRQMAMVLKEAPEEQIQIPLEIAALFDGLSNLLEKLPETKDEQYDFWKKSHYLRDEYLRTTHKGLSGKERYQSAAELARFIEAAQRLVESAIGRAQRSKDGVYHTYLYHEVTRWTVLEEGKDGNPPRVWPEAFLVHDLPNFLEGQVHALRGEKDHCKAETLYEAVRKSDLFDDQLEMYKVCADLTASPYEIGRSRVFPRGWLENESVFLHMEYKYLLEILRSGLYDNFFAELPKLLVCYAKPEVYGRNPLENCSFIVTSCNPQRELHGNGFIARLSGSTAEMLHMWLVMSFGLRPFRLNNNGQLELSVAPVLTDDFFTRTEQEIEVAWWNGLDKKYRIPKDAYTAKFLGKTLVVYHNPNRKKTYGSDAAVIVRITLTTWDGVEQRIEGSTVSGEWAEKVRRGLVERIDFELQ